MGGNGRQWEATGGNGGDRPQTTDHGSGQIAKVWQTEAYIYILTKNPIETESLFGEILQAWYTNREGFVEGFYINKACYTNREF